MNRALSLSGVAVGAAGFGAALAAAYESMREVMVDNGGFCASGGPYQVAAGHQCSDRTWVLTAAPFAGLLFAAILVGASGAWSNGRVGGVGALLFGGTFAALGWNFLDLGINPPPSMSSTGAWIFCAVLFFAMALGGLVYASYGLREYFRPPGSAPSTPAALPPLVKAVAANVPGVDVEMPGMKLLNSLGTTTDDGPGGNAYAWLLTLLVACAAGAAVVAALW